jgi:hypothetical protein
MAYLQFAALFFTFLFSEAFGFGAYKALMIVKAMPMVLVIGDESSVCITHSHVQQQDWFSLSFVEYIVQQYKSKYILVRYSTKVACLSINEIHLTYPVSAWSI